jgi:hypothetical protein
MIARTAPSVGSRILENFLFDGIAVCSSPDDSTLRIDFCNPALANYTGAIRTRDGAVILMSYTGLVEQTAAFKCAAEQNQGTDWDDQYMRLSIMFATNDERYRWLERSLFVAAGRLEGTGLIEYAVHRVV